MKKIMTIFVLFSCLFIINVQAQEVNAEDVQELECITCETSQEAELPGLFESFKQLVKLDFTAEAYPCRADFCGEECTSEAMFVTPKCARMTDPIGHDYCVSCVADTLWNCWNSCYDDPCYQETGWTQCILPPY